MEIVPAPGCQSAKRDKNPRQNNKQLLGILKNGNKRTEKQADKSKMLKQRRIGGEKSRSPKKCIQERAKISKTGRNKTGKILSLKSSKSKMQPLTAK